MNEEIQAGTAVIDVPAIATDEIEEEEKVILPYAVKGEYYIEPLGEIPKKRVYSLVKRLFDIVCSALAMILLALPMLVIALMIKKKSPGPVFYRQKRQGHKGEITITKFRTMDVNAEKTGAQWSQGDDDPRIFPFGRKLRRMRLDELPQLWAIFKGDLSFVGPRPERECFYKEFETYVHGFSERLKVKQGMTGLAQINGGYDLAPEEKIRYDIEYIRKRGLWTDLKILFRTVSVIFKHDGAK